MENFRRYAWSSLVAGTTLVLILTGSCSSDKLSRGQAEKEIVELLGFPSPVKELWAIEHIKREAEAKKECEDLEPVIKKGFLTCKTYPTKWRGKLKVEIAFTEEGKPYLIGKRRKYLADLHHYVHAGSPSILCQTEKACLHS